MISGDFQYCKDLLHFYDEIVKVQREAHGPEYCRVHNAIEIALQPGNKRYIELGINQGATLACANTIQGGLKFSKAYDINLQRFEPYRHLFEKHAKKKHRIFEAKKLSSTDPNIVEKCDVLYIDTVHQWNYLNKELDLWNRFVTETIICHDTYAKPEMHKGIVNWLLRHPEWHLKEYNKDSVGYTVLRRI